MSAPYQHLRTGAGGAALLSLGLLLFFYGQAVAGSFRMSLPSISLGLGSLSSGPLTSYQENPTISIPSLGVEAPIVRDVPVGDQVVYEEALRGGVAQARGSADLESDTGNSFIFGHSSNITLRPTGFDKIFAGLPKLQKGDTLVLRVGGRSSEYKVETSQSIEASAVQYLSSSTDRKVTLVTCWPLGTDYKRWVVEASRAE